MPIHVLPEMPSVPPVFMIWRRVLACFSDMDAVHIDCVYGCTQINWLIRHRITALPSSYTWTMAAKAHSLGMMVYLQTYAVPCTNINDIVQYALDCNYVRMLVFMCDPDFNIQGSSAIQSPRLDTALRHGYYEAVTYVLFRFSSIEIKRPDFVVQHLAEHGLLRMLRLIIPRVMLVPSYTCLIGAITKGSYATLTYCLQHMDTSVCNTTVLPPDLLICAAENGRLRELVMLAERQSQYVPDEVYHRAFQAGQLEACAYLRTLNPRLRPSLEDIDVVCTRGFEHMVRSLEFNVSVHGKLIIKAIRSKNSELVRTLTNKMPHLSFKSTKQNLLLVAANTGDATMLLTVFDVGKYTTVPNSVITACVEHGMHRALKLFRSLDLFVYTETMIIEACRMCDDIMLHLILKSRDLYAALNNTTNSLYERCQSYIVVSAALPAKKQKCHAILSGVRATTEQSNHESAMLDKVRALKRPKHVHE